jgi:TRAP-type C4-dicarboxylate transport system substrate-binding protein
MRHRYFWSAAALAAALVAPPAKAQETIKLTFVCAHPTIFLWAKHYQETLMPAVDKALERTGKYKIEWNKAFGGTLAKVNEEFRTIEQGLADLGQSMTLYETARMPLHTVAYYAPFPPQPIDTEVGVLVVEDLQRKIPAFGQMWDKYHQHYLGGGIAVDVFNLWSKFPIRTVDDLKGKKIGGAPPTANWLKNTGAVHVTTQMANNYNSLQTGVIDGVMLFVSGAFPAKYHEVAPYITVGDVGATYSGGLSMNLERWKKMPKEVQDAIQEGVNIYHKAFYGDLKAQLANYWEQQKKTDAKIYVLPESERVRWAKMLPALGKEWAETMEKQGLPGKQVMAGYIAGIEKTGSKYTRAWDKE